MSSCRQTFVSNPFASGYSSRASVITNGSPESAARRARRRSTLLRRLHAPAERGYSLSHGRPLKGREGMEAVASLALPLGFTLVVPGIIVLIIIVVLVLWLIF